MKASGAERAWAPARGLACALALMAAGLVQAQTRPGPPVTAAGLGAGWRVAQLPAQQVPATRFEAERVPAPGGERLALRLQAEGSYGALAHALPGVPLPARLRWSWRVSEANAAVDLRRKAGDDSPAKVCLSVDLPLARVPFVERQLLRLARSRSGEDLPAATLCWVWGGAEPAGTVLANPYTRRVRAIVLRGAAEAGAGWFDEDRDVAADLRLAFGDELDPAPAALPPVTALIVGADADNTGGRSLAHIAGLQWLP